MLHYVVQKIKSPSDGTVKYYLQTRVEQMIDLEALAEHMAKHNTPFSRGTIKGVLDDMVSCIRELCLEGNSVKLDNLAVFSIGISSAGKATPEEVSASDVKSVHLNARATGEFKPSELRLDATFSEQAEYTRITSDTATDDTTGD